jgi:hypothetical protein
LGDFLDNLLKEDDAKVVVFGPFVGEFGWELMHWMGWVKAACAGQYSNFRKIAVSYPGRQPLYPDVDEFIPIPEWLDAKSVSPRNYILDGWINGFPGKLDESKYEWDWDFVKYRIKSKQKPHRIPLEEPYEWSDAKKFAQDAHTFCISLFPKSDVTYVSPWKLNYNEGSLFGFNDQVPYKFLSHSKNIYRFPNPEFEWSNLKSTSKGKDLLDSICDKNSKFITIFPRMRVHRREDKNWGVGNYLETIKLLQRNYPDHRIVIAGERNGAYFKDGVPENCLDLINIEAEFRLDAQIAALERSAFALGSLSGAMFLPLMTKTPTIVFGFGFEKERFEKGNLLGTKLSYIQESNPTVLNVISACDEYL